MTLTQGNASGERTAAPLPVGWFPGQPVYTSSCVSDSSVTVTSDSLYQNPDCEEPNRSFIFYFFVEKEVWGKAVWN